MKEVPFHAEVLAFLVIIGMPIIDYLDHTYIYGPMIEQTKAYDYYCKHDKDKCWIIVK